MKVFAISDLHLSTSTEKPMNIFGDEWQNHFEKVANDWQSKVRPDDLVLLGGDISWGINLDEAESDYNQIDNLNGRKVVVKGNHDYYWSSLNKIQTRFKNFTFIQNNSTKIDNIIIAGSRGWTIPVSDTENADTKIYQHELLRLEMSLMDAQKSREDCDILIALLHFPPFDANFSSTEVTDLLEKYKVDKVVYGHLHGKNARVADNVRKNGIDYYLTSCDLVKNQMTLILDTDTK